MLGKVMKYEFRSSARLLLPMFGLALLLSVVMRLVLLVVPYIWTPLGTVLTSFASAAGVLLPAAVVILSFVAVVVRFAQSMAGDEAYLTFTLPVKAGTHLMGRLVVSTLSVVAGSLVALACGYIFIPGFATTNGLITINGNSVPVESLGITITFWIKAAIVGLVVLLLVVSLIKTLLNVYGGIGLGIQLPKHKVLAGIGGYLVLNFLGSIVTLVAILLPFFNFLTSEEKMQELFARLTTGAPAEVLGNVMQFATVTVLIFCAIMLIISAGYYYLTRYFFGRKLNLE